MLKEMAFIIKKFVQDPSIARGQNHRTSEGKSSIVRGLRSM